MVALTAVVREALERRLVGREVRPASTRTRCGCRPRRPSGLRTRRSPSAPGQPSTRAWMTLLSRVVVSRNRQKRPMSAGPTPATSSAGAGTERGDDDAAERERAELGAVARAVVGGERAAAQRVGHALVDQRAQQHVLDAVGDAAEHEPDQRHPQHRGRAPRPRCRRPGASTATSPPTASRRRARGGRARAEPGGHAERPRGQQDPVGERAAVEHVGDEERLGGDRDREDGERGDRAAERDREVTLAERGTRSRRARARAPPCVGRAPAAAAPAARAR